jgi:hypothetical protein
LNTENLHSPVAEVHSHVINREMTTAEKVYTALVIVCGVLILLPLAVFHFMIIPKSDNPQVFYFVLAVLWIYLLTITTTTTINLCYRSLVIIPTIVQCVILCLAIYFIPIGIWGGYLLYHRTRRTTGVTAVLSP